MLRPQNTCANGPCGVHDCLGAHRRLPVQGGIDVCTFTVSLAGQPGSVTVHAQDSDGPEGSSRLTPDSLEINLSAGPMAGLAFEEMERLHCGLRDSIGALKLLAVDAYGNTASCAPFEVKLPTHVCSTRQKARAKGQINPKP